MSETTRYRKQTPPSARRFGLFCVGVFVLYGVFPVIHERPPRLWALAIAVGFLTATVFRPAALKFPNQAWFALGLLLGRIVSPIVMGFFYFVIVTPVALFMRLAGRDALRLKLDRAAQSYWIARDQDSEAEPSMRQQF